MTTHWCSGVNIKPLEHLKHSVGENGSIQFYIVTEEHLVDTENSKESNEHFEHLF